MKRFHVHVAVEDLPASIRFYSTVFGAPPTVQKSDYAKWMMEDPRVNFAISQRGSTPGLDHLGIQVESAEELVALRSQVADAQIAAVDQADAACCYARSDKYWTTDPQGIAWETFHTLDTIPVYGDTHRAEPRAPDAPCCAPATATIAMPSSKRKECC